MRIALISTYSNASPPLAYGGESYFWGIAKTLAEMGHEVWLFGAGGSEIPCNGKLYYLMGSSRGMVSLEYEEWMYQKYKDIIMEADIVHDCSLSHIMAEKLKHLHGKTNIINTINGSTYYLPRPPFNVVTGSKFWQQDAKKHGLNTEMIYWGIDTDFYTPNGAKEDYLLWLARFHPDKGIDLALNLAEYLGIQLKVAGSMQFYDHEQYGRMYLEKIKKMPNVEYIQLPMDSTHHITKRELYRKAKAFLYPVQYKECFGMVAVEAMACGTPVITTDSGAMPELINDKHTGFICKTKNDFVNAISSFPEYERNGKFHPAYDFAKNCREQALKFTWKKATEQYINLYEKVKEGYQW